MRLYEKSLYEETSLTDRLNSQKESNQNCSSLRPEGGGRSGDKSLGYCWGLARGSNPWESNNRATQPLSPKSLVDPVRHANLWREAFDDVNSKLTIFLLQFLEYFGSFGPNVFEGLRNWFEYDGAATVEL